MVHQGLMVLRTGRQQSRWQSSPSIRDVHCLVRRCFAADGQDTPPALFVAIASWQVPETCDYRRGSERNDEFSKTSKMAEGRVSVNVLCDDRFCIIVLDVHLAVGERPMMVCAVKATVEPEGRCAHTKRRLSWCDFLKEVFFIKNALI